MDSDRMASEEHIRSIQEISIAIDSWDDVFSDFDPSPLAERVLSEDFLFELKKRYRETQRGNFVITIYAPASLKDESSERIVIRRLRQYFKYRYLSLTKNVRSLRAKGGLFIFLGIMALGGMTLVTYAKVLSELTLELVGIILVPLGWFGIWEGFSKMIDPAPKLTDEKEIFDKLSKAVIKFKYATGTELKVEMVIPPAKTAVPVHPAPQEPTKPVEK